MDDARTATVRFKITDKVPEGELAVPVESEGRLTFAIKPGEMTPELAASLNRFCDHFTRNGMWLQNWGGDEQPPQYHRRAS